MPKLVPSMKNQFEYEGIYNRSEVEETVNSLPPGSELYNLDAQIVVRLQKNLDLKKQAKACRILSWVYFARRPLALRELRDALAIYGWEKSVPPMSFQQHLSEKRCVLLDEENWMPFVREISDLSGCLLEVVQFGRTSGRADVRQRTATNVAEDVVQFTHQTVVEFLLRHNKVNFKSIKSLAM